MWNRWGSHLRNLPRTMVKMGKKMQIKIIFALLFMVNFTYSQLSNWYLVNPTPTVNILGDVIQLDDGSWIAIGGYKTVLKSNDFGVTWNKINVNIPSSISFFPYVGFSSVDFINETGFLIESRGHVLLKSTDSGNSWSAIPNFDLSTYGNDLDFLNEDTGFVFCHKTSPTRGYVYKTYDGGITWQQKLFFNGERVSRGAIFSDSTGYAQGENRLFKTTDMGESWFPIFYDSSRQMANLNFENSTTGYLVFFDGTILKTENGAQNFTTFYQFPDLTQDVYFNGNIGHVLANGTRAYSTTDGGSSWYTYNFPTHGALLLSLNFVDPDTGFVCGNFGEIYKTSNSGITWERVKNTFTYDSFYDLEFVNNNEGFLASIAGIYQTTDGGSNWQKLQNLPNYVFLGIDFPSPQYGYAASTNGAVYKTNNSGNSWIQILNTNVYFHKVHFYDESFGIVSGENGKVFKTIDGGEFWEEISIPFNITIFNCFVLNKNRFIVIGDSGYICHTNDGGMSWNYLQTQPDDNFKGIDFCNDLNGLIVGSSWSPYESLIYLTTDGGITWEKKNTTVQFGFEAVDFFSLSEAIAIGKEGAMSYTNDGGNNWEIVDSEIGQTFYSLRVLDNHQAVAVGVLGMIAKNDNIVSVYQPEMPIIPKSVVLYQNYPNPFNPITTIRFQLPKPEHIKLHIFDILGRKVQTLIDERKEIGLYEVKWNGTDDNGLQVSSGIYIYQLRVGNVIRNQKMLLLK